MIVLTGSFLMKELNWSYMFNNQYHGFSSPFFLRGCLNSPSSQPCEALTLRCRIQVQAPATIVMHPTLFKGGLPTLKISTKLTLKLNKSS